MGAGLFVGESEDCGQFPVQFNFQFSGGIRR
jgi:hypothetical protein